MEAILTIHSLSRYDKGTKERRRKMAQYILALDQGTTSSRAILFDREQNILAIRQHELTPVSYTHLTLPTIA